MRWYKDASPQVRNKNMRLFLKYKKLGLIPEAKKCHICGRTNPEIKRIDWHNEEYIKSNALLESVNCGSKKFSEIKDELMSYVKPTCFSCHSKIHKTWMKNIDYFNNPKYKDDWDK